MISEPKNYALPLFLALFLTLTAVPLAGQEEAAFPAATPESQGMSAQALESLAKVVQDFSDTGVIVGAELLVIKNRRTVLHRVFGWRDREDELPMVPHTIFNIRSMTKPLTGAALQMLIDEGEVEPQAPVADYLPGFLNDKSEMITVEQLLTHRSGLPGTILKSPTDYPDLISLGNAAGEHGPQFPPDSKFWYSDVATDVVGAIIQEVSGLPLDEFVRTRLLEPLGMKDALYTPETDDDPRWQRVASLYAGNASNWTRFWTPKQGSFFYPFPWGSQSVYCTPTDYAHFLAMWLDGGMVREECILSPEAIQRSLRPVSRMSLPETDTPTPTGFKGMEVWYGQMATLHVQAAEGDGSPQVVIVGHSGADGTRAWAWPEEDLMVFYFTQSRGQATSLRLEQQMHRLLFKAARQTVATAAEEQDDFAERLERLAVHMEQERVEQHIPGMSLAVVRGDELVLARGFGVADLETQSEVTPDTIFPIGSSTKSFTATLIGILADEGRLDWDDAATQYLPWFELPIDRGKNSPDDVQVTLRDLLSHRTGFMRMNGLLINKGLSTEEILRGATAAEPWSPFRSKFNYSNVMFVAAGVCAGIAAESDWASALRTRLLDPLGMSSTFTSPAEVSEDPRLAQGYMWEPDFERHQHRPFPDATRIGPAGSINSNVTDMARWLRFQLAGGEIDGKRLIDAERLAETRRTQTPIGGGTSYGLGWMLRNLDGHRVVEHGGNVQGFTAEVCLFPDSDLGFVLLMNQAGAPLQKESMVIVADILLGEPKGAGLARDDVEDFLGEYVANYLTHENEVYEVKLSEGTLMLDIPTQQAYALDPPDGEGPWHFAISDTVAVTFDRDDKGRVTGLSIYSSGFRFEVPRRGFEPKGEIPLEQLQRFVGRYQLEGRDTEVELSVRDERLALSMQGLPQLFFFPPDEDGTWKCRTHNAVELRFEENPEGGSISLSMISPWFRGSAVRTTGAAESELPTLEEVLELRGNAERGRLLKALGGLKWQGEVAMPQSGVKGSFTASADGLRRFRQKLDLGRFGFLCSGLDGDRGWEQAMSHEVEEVSGERLAYFRTTSPAAPAGDWFELYESAQVLGIDKLGERDVVRVRLTPAIGPTSTVFVDLESGDTLEEHNSIPLWGLGAVPIVVRYGAWREVEGLRMPFSITSEEAQTGRTIITIEEIETGLEFAEGHFTRVQ